jgi:hypothetical protein
MSAEVWLRTNARAVWFGMALPAVVTIAGVLLLAASFAGESSISIRIGGAALVVFGLLLLAALAAQLRRPRLAYRDGQLLVGLRSGPPLGVPIEFVEGFLLGKAPSLLPGKRHRHMDSAALVIRIADAATDWRFREVKPQLGAWCDGYITIRGTWCEPLTLALVNRLNQRLAEVSTTKTKLRGASS